MRILLTGDTAGGVFTFVKELATGLASRRHFVTLATFGPEPTQSLPQVRWLHCTGRLEWQPDPWQDVQRAGEWLGSLVARERPELLHLNTLCHGDLGWRIPTVTTIHSCVLTWWDAVRRSAIPASWEKYREVVRRSLSAATILVTPTAALRDALMKTWPLDFSGVRVIPNGRSSKLFHRTGKQPFLVSAGRFGDEAKNVMLLDRIAPRLRWPIYLAGEANEAANCRRLGNLEQEELARWFARASIYVSPALYEPFGLAILESAMSGCALVLNDIPSLRELWHDAAIFAAPEEFERAIEQLIDDPTEMQRRALDRAQSFTQARMVSRYVALFQEALSIHKDARSYSCAS